MSSFFTRVGCAPLLTTLLLCYAIFFFTQHLRTPEIPFSEEIELNTTPETINCPQPPFNQTRNLSLVVRLASFPGSGNTFVRQLLETGSGYHTGAIYIQELRLDGSGLLVEQDFPKNLVVKDHDPMCKELQNGGFLANMSRSDNETFFRKKDSVRPIVLYPRKYDAVIYLLRNPRDAIFSYFNMLKGNSHVISPQFKAYQTQEFADFVYLSLPCWLGISQYYLKARLNQDEWIDQNKKPVMLVYYEDVRRNPQEELRRMFEFINSVHARPVVEDVDRAISCAKLSKENTKDIFREGMTDNTRVSAFDGLKTRNGESMLSYLYTATRKQQFWTKRWEAYF